MVDTIKLMKQRVLDMAIRGELVEQRPEEGTAKELLVQVEEEKQRLIEEKKIKKEKKLPEITKQEVPFEIPENWKWIRLGDIFNFIDYRGKTPTKITEGIRLITAKNVKKGFISLSPEEFISPEEHSVRNVRGDIKIGDILITTEAPMGNVAVNDIEEEIAIAQRLICLQNYVKQDNGFYSYFLQSNYFQTSLLDWATGTTVKGIKASNLKKIIINVPPLDEQKRITEKVENVFSVIDKIAERKEDALQTIELIRQTTLQEAIQGNLVEQDENDEPASELIKRIEAEKEQLIKEKKIKKEKKIPKITGEEKPFDIPKSWEWVRLGSMIQLISGRDLKASEYNDVGEGIPYFTGASNFLNGEVIINRWTTAPKVVSEKGDLLITVKGTIGEMAVQSIEEAHIARQIMAIRNIYELNLKYIQYFIYSRIVELQTKAKSMIPGISRDDILSFEFPLPPIQEQKRIVEKVEKIMHICNSMEKILKGSLEEVVMTS